MNTKITETKKADTKRYQLNVFKEKVL